MATVEERNIVDVPTIIAWTGLNRKTVSSWVNERSQLPHLQSRIAYGKVFDWAVVRPIIMELSKDLNRKPPRTWPRAVKPTEP